MTNSSEPIRPVGPRGRDVYVDGAHSIRRVTRREGEPSYEEQYGAPPRRAHTAAADDAAGGDDSGQQSAGREHEGVWVGVRDDEDDVEAYDARGRATHHSDDDEPHQHFDAVV